MKWLQIKVLQMVARVLKKLRKKTFSTVEFRSIVFCVLMIKQLFILVYIGYMFMFCCYFRV